VHASRERQRAVRWSKTSAAAPRARQALGVRHQAVVSREREAVRHHHAAGGLPVGSPDGRYSHAAQYASPEGNVSSARSIAQA
jgi:hypothetical protein